MVLSSSLLAQNGITATLSATMGTESRYGIEVGYQYEDINVYAEASYGAYSINNMAYNTPSVRVGADYSFIKIKKIQFFAGAYAGFTLFDNGNSKYAYIKNSVKADALTVGVKAGVKINVGKRMFVRAAALLNNHKWDRTMGISINKGVNGKYDAGVNFAVGVRF